MFTDIVGYTALTQKDESSTLQALERHRSLLRPLFSSHGGREIKTVGDAFLVEFQSALDAVLCAVAVQQMMHDRKVARGEQLSLRVGIHVGDVVESGNDILGDAVNIASRIYPLAEPGGICISDEAYRQVRNKSDLQFVSLGEKSLKNVDTPVEVFKAVMPWEKSASGEATSYPSNRIAILPFVSMSTNPDDAFFADGVTEEIISTASGIGGLGVISRTSVMRYKGTNKSVEEIGKELKVGSVLEGSFRKAGNKIRVTAQLINVADDQHLWAQSYDRNLDDVFEVQSDVAKQVAEALRVRILSPERERIEKKPTESTVAYTLYLRGRSLWNKRSLGDIKKAMEYFELAVKEDPGFALGYVGQADCAVVLMDYFIDSEENLAKAKAMVEKALQLDPALAEAHTTLGMVYYGEYDLRRAEEEIKKAIELKPSYATAHQWYSFVLRSELRWDEALRESEKAVELDPLSGIIMWNLGWTYMGMKDWQKAAEKFRVAVEAGYEGAHYGLFDAFGMMKLYDQMEKEGEVFVRTYQDTWPHLKTYVDAYGAYFKGDKETVRRLLPELEAYPNKALFAWATDIALLNFFAGDVDKGFEWLERAYSKREHVLLDIRWGFDVEGNIRNDPRYIDFVKRLGLEETPKRN
jgi:TolB-like protein